MEGLRRQRRWYHSLFPYANRQELVFDDATIKEVLLASRSGDKDLDTSLVKRLMDTVKISESAELVSSVYYVHISVTEPITNQILKHTFEVLR